MDVQKTANITACRSLLLLPLLVGQSLFPKLGLEKLSSLLQQKHFTTLPSNALVKAEIASWSDAACGEHGLQTLEWAVGALRA